MKKLLSDSRFARRIVIATILVLLAPASALVMFRFEHGGPSKKPAPKTETVTAAPGDNPLAQQPLRFVENRGQADAEIRYHVEAAGHTVLFSPHAVTFRRSSASTTAQVTVRFVGAEAQTQLEGRNPLPGTTHFYRGADASRWQTQVPAYAEVHYTGLYPGIDLIYFGTVGRLKSEFHVAAGADPGVIRLVYDGMQSLRIHENGALVLTTALGEVIEARPEVYQRMEGKRVPVEADYRLLDARTVGFNLSEYDSNFPLVIDPEFLYLTYLGGSGFDNVQDLGVNSTGDIFVAGVTNSNDFPTANAAQGQFAGGFLDFFVARIDTSTGTLVYSTYLGGSGDESSLRLLVDSADTVYVVGSTRSADFPTLNALQPNSGGADEAVVARLAPDGTLLYSTYLGGDGVDRGKGVALDASGNVWLTGYTESTDFPTTANALQDTSAGGRDAFLAQLSPDGSMLLYSTYLGGSARDNSNALAIDAQGSLFLAGDTQSEDFAGMSLQSAAAFVAWLGYDGQTVTLDTVTVVDGSEFDSASALADGGSYIFFGGSAGAGLPTTSGAAQPDYGGGGSDGMVGAFNEETRELAYLSYQGTSEFDFITDLTVENQTPAGTNTPFSNTDSKTMSSTLLQQNAQFVLKYALGLSALVEIAKVFEVGLIPDPSQLLLPTDTPFETLNIQNTFFNTIVISALGCFVAGSTTDGTLPTTRNAVGSNLSGGDDGFLAIVKRQPGGAPKLEIEKTIIGSDRVDLGETMTFEITVRNTGTEAASNILVLDPLPFGLEPDIQSGPCEVTRELGLFTLECSYATLAPGEEQVITFDAYTTRSSSSPPDTNFAVILVGADSSKVEVARDQVPFEIMKVIGEQQVFNGFDFGGFGADFLAKLSATSSLDVYVDSVRIADNLTKLSAVRVPVLLKRTTPRIDIVDGAAPDNSNPLASFQIDLLVGDSTEVHFSPSNLFFIAPAANDSLTLRVKNDARFEASDPTRVELLLANLAAQAGALDFRISGGGRDTTLAQLGFGDFSDYVSGAPGSYDIEILQTSDDSSLGTYRFAFDTFQGQTLTLVVVPADSSGGGSTDVLASAEQAAVTLVAFDSSGAQVPGANVTSVVTGDEPLPQRFVLHQNYPNPFNPETTIRYDLPVPAEVRLTIYDVLGQKVRTLVAKKQAAGAHSAVWDGRDDAGRHLASGVYVYRLEAGEFKKSGKMLLLK